MGNRYHQVIMLLALVILMISPATATATAIVDVGKKNYLSMQIHNKLKLLNKPAINTIYSEDGDIIDCVDIYKQPALDHPALKNHTIQMKPDSAIDYSTTPTARNESFGSNPFQVWQRSGRCPEGTIPIRRIHEQDLLRTKSLDHFGKKFPYDGSKLGPEISRSTALLAITGMNYIGASGELNIWNPRVDLTNDFSASQIWLKNGPSEKFDSVEAGWVVNPRLYGDAKTRLSLYWTTDSYKSTGCFDLTCSGFVQTNPSVVIGSVIDPMSSTGGQQYIISIGIFQEPNSGNWWLKVQGQPVGYWPGKLFGYLSHSATLVEWGGEVFSSNVRKVPHTRTAMGSGDYAGGHFKHASFVKKPRIVDYSSQLKYPERFVTWTDERTCYSADNYQQSVTVEPIFYFGGPGLSRDCH